MRDRELAGCAHPSSPRLRGRPVSACLVRVVPVIRLAVPGHDHPCAVCHHGGMGQPESREAGAAQRSFRRGSGCSAAGRSRTTARSRSSAANAGSSGSSAPRPTARSTAGTTRSSRRCRTRRSWPICTASRNSACSAPNGAGFPPATILELAPPAPDVTHVMVWAEYGFSSNLRLDGLRRRDARSSPRTRTVNCSPPSTASRVRLVVPASVRLEGPQMGPRHRVHDGRPPRLLGGARLPQHRRPLDGAALLLPGGARGRPGALGPPASAGRLGGRRPVGASVVAAAPSEPAPRPPRGPPCRPGSRSPAARPPSPGGSAVRRTAPSPMWPAPMFACRSLWAPTTSLESLAWISRSRPAPTVVHQLVQGPLHPAGRGQVVAGGEDVAGVEADAELRMGVQRLEVRAQVLGTASRARSPARPSAPAAASGSSSWVSSSSSGSNARATWASATARDRPPVAEPVWTTTPSAPISRPAPQRMPQRLHRPGRRSPRCANRN